MGATEACSPSNSYAHSIPSVPFSLRTTIAVAFAGAQTGQRVSRARKKLYSYSERACREVFAICLQRSTEQEARHESTLDTAYQCWSERVWGASPTIPAFSHRAPFQRHMPHSLQSLLCAFYSVAGWVAQVSYSKLIHGLTQENIQVNRKLLSELAMREPTSFQALVNQVPTPIPETPIMWQASFFLYSKRYCGSVVITLIIYVVCPVLGRGRSSSCAAPHLAALQHLLNHSSTETYDCPSWAESIS